MSLSEFFFVHVEIELNRKAFRKYPLLREIALIQDVEKNKRVVVEGILEDPGIHVCFLAGFLNNRKMSCDKDLTIPVRIGKQKYEIPYRLIRRMVFRAK